VTWQGQLQNKDGNMNIGLEAFANQSLWIWHVFFGLLQGQQWYQCAR
jgi:hypothetical protein